MLPECTKADPFAGRAGLVGTQNIRNNQSRVGGLDYVASGGTIVEAVDNQPWSGEANVHVSIVNWVKTKDKALLPAKRRLWSKIEKPAAARRARKKGSGPAAKEFELACRECALINSALSNLTDVSGAKPLAVNTQPKLVYQGQNPVHDGFLLTPEEATVLIKRNPRLRDVIFPYIIGRNMIDNVRASRFVIDFAQRDMIQASSYAEAFKIIQRKVMPTVLQKAEAEKVATGKESTRWCAWRRRWWQFRNYQPGTMGESRGFRDTLLVREFPGGGYSRS